MNRTQKLKLNTMTSFGNRIVRIISGLILPRLILVYFGSETNGLVASITQFLNIITFLDLGVGSVVQAALYRPIAKNDKHQISAVLSAAKSYFNKIAYALIAYIILLMIFYPIFVDSNYDFLSTAFLIIALSISLFGQYYFGIVNELLLNANQQAYVQYGSEIVAVILNVILSVFLITNGASIQIVKLGSGLVFLIRPLFLSLYVKRNIDVDYEVEVKEDPLPQRWSGMGQHIAYSIHNSTDVVTLSLFSTLENVSIYNVHNMIVHSISLLLTSLTTGIRSFFGDMFARDEIDLLNNYFDKIEWIIHTGVTFLYGMTAVLINSFVMIYTAGVEDINYYAPIFSFLLVLGKTFYSIRIPYQTMILAVGHFKETEKSSYIEAGLNIIVSIVLVNWIGLSGIALGTLISMIYRTLYLVNYLANNIIYRPITKFVKHIFVDAISMAAVIVVGTFILNIYQIRTLTDWVLVAVLLAVFSIVLFIIINYLFYRSTMISVLKGLIRRS